MTREEIVIASIDELHQPVECPSGTIRCVLCFSDEPWPCRTHLLIHPDAGAPLRLAAPAPLRLPEKTQPEDDDWEVPF